MKTRKVMSRREALGALALLSLAGPTLLGAAAEKPSPKSKKARIALQMYTLRDPAKKDLADTLKKAADMGWQYVQWSGMPNLPAPEIRAALDKAGLTCIAAHVSIEAFEKDFDGQVAFWKTVGATDVAPGGMMNDCRADLQAWIRGAERLNALGAKLRAVGMRLSFHNHTEEFTRFPNDPRTKHEILMETTRRKNLCAELDLAWAAAGGADPAALMLKYKGRCPVVHAKDVFIEGKKHTLVPLGKGSVKWDEVFAAGRKAGVEWYIYEQDSGQGSPFDYARESYQFLSRQSL